MTKQRECSNDKKLRSQSFVIRASSLLRHSSFVLRHLRRRRNHATRPQQFLNFFPLPQGHGSFRPTFGTSRRTGARSSVSSEPSPFDETSPSLAAIRSP